MAVAVAAGILAVASPANAVDTPRPSIAELQQLMASGSVNVIDLTGAATIASMVEAKSGDKFPKGKVYRTGLWQPPHALEPLSGFTEFIVCDTLGSQVWTIVQNPNDVPAPLDFAVSSATWEGYGGTEYASPGWNIIITIMDPDTYDYTVGWYDQRLVFARNELTVTCPSPPDPEWPSAG